MKSASSPTSGPATPASTAAETQSLRASGITRARCLLSGDSAAVSEGLVQLTLPPESARIYRLI